MNHGEELPPQKRRRLSPPPVNGNGRPAEFLPAPPPRLEPSFIGYDPFDDFTKQVADWIADMIRGKEDVEVEGKIGIVFDELLNRRIDLPVLSETIISPSVKDRRFQSTMTVNQHRHYNDLLNKRVELSATAPPSMFMKFAHTRGIDSFYKVPDDEGKVRVRVSRDEKTGDITESVKKTRLGDMDVLCPRWAFDYRISVNKELPSDPPAQEVRPERLRRKDRVSYTHQAYRIDLTQVYPHPAPAKGEAGITHELEVEFLNSAVLVRECAKRDKGEPSMFDEMIQVFLNNIRILIRSAVPPE
ncbi:mRNA triphosphatase CET1 [Dacryopinax primogenitus]|uniref:mRNA-capping enzyme subunit beta n=1 Tax=Dacryopinax primogenitus (strain DJM 731) TaxID=1858805 RepID=M5FYH4_DACPD|nr:mRNA triphosphatase CET1 [Dacryopinax primogenitus]EJU03096.1 mRNA triphosphatase CET1 [Dacryopinax primogenitus]